MPHVHRYQDIKYILCLIYRVNIQCMTALYLTYAPRPLCQRKVPDIHCVLIKQHIGGLLKGPGDGADEKEVLSMIAIHQTKYSGGSRCSLFGSFEPPLAALYLHLILR